MENKDLQNKCIEYLQGLEFYLDGCALRCAQIGSIIESAITLEPEEQILQLGALRYLVQDLRSELERMSDSVHTATTPPEDTTNL
jgi:uncharacterized metal-binding protein